MNQIKLIEEYGRYIFTIMYEAAQVAFVDSVVAI
jgi:hypothetical protein